VERLGDAAGDRGEALPGVEQARAVQVGGEVAVAEVEPPRLAEAGDLVEGVEGLVAEAPALALVDDAAQRGAAWRRRCRPRAR